MKSCVLVLPDMEVNCIRIDSRREPGLCIAEKGIYCLALLCVKGRVAAAFLSLRMVYFASIKGTHFFLSSMIVL